MSYTTALEAALVPEKNFVARLLRERAIRLLGLNSESALSAKRLLTKFYDIRSTLVHGGSVEDQLSFLQDRDRWLEFERLTRNLIVAAVKNVPSEQEARLSFLKGLWDVDDTARAEKLRQDFKAIKDAAVRRDLLKSLE